MQVLDFSNPQVPITNILNPRQPVQEALGLLTLPTTRMSATDLAAREELRVDHLLDLLGLEVTAQALLGSEATRTPEGFHCFNLKNTPIVNIPISVCGA